MTSNSDFKPKDLINFKKSTMLDRSQIAEIIGVTPDAVRHWETGYRDIPEPIKRIFLLFKAKPEIMDIF